jgi:UDP-N-acetyl-D-mannosaminuronate dehydrogenase
MPAHVVNTLEKLHGSLYGQRVVVFGVAYRGEVKESAFSGVFPTIAALRELGAVIFVHDPLYSDSELANLGFNPYHYGGSVDAAIIQTDHLEYREITITQVPEVKTLIDGRGVTKDINWPGVNYHVLGRAL